MGQEIITGIIKKTHLKDEDWYTETKLSTLNFVCGRNEFTNYIATTLDLYSNDYYVLNDDLTSIKDILRYFNDAYKDNMLELSKTINRINELSIMTANAKTPEMYDKFKEDLELYKNTICNEDGYFWDCF